MKYTRSVVKAAAVAAALILSTSAGLTQSAMGTAEAHAFSGTGLGSKWSAPNKRSAFWGEFVY